MPNTAHIDLEQGQEPAPGEKFIISVCNVNYGCRWASTTMAGHGGIGSRPLKIAGLW
jgi:hypothetical protein